MYYALCVENKSAMSLEKMPRFANNDAPRNAPARIFFVAPGFSWRKIAAQRESAGEYMNSELLTWFNKLLRCAESPHSHRNCTWKLDASFKQIIIKISDCIRNNVIIVLENLL